MIRVGKPVYSFFAGSSLKAVTVPATQKNDLIVVGVYFWSSSTRTVDSVTDDTNDVFKSAGPDGTNNLSGTSRMALWYGTSAGGTTVVTPHLDASGTSIDVIIGIYRPTAGLVLSFVAGLGGNGPNSSVIVAPSVVATGLSNNNLIVSTAADPFGFCSAALPNGGVTFNYPAPNPGYDGEMYLDLLNAGQGPYAGKGLYTVHNPSTFSATWAEVVATYTIKGGTGVAGARVQCVGPAGTQFQVCDSSGNYTFTVADLATYTLMADTYGVTGGSAGYLFRTKHGVSVNGGNVADVNFQSTAPNASNDRAPGNF